MLSIATAKSVRYYTELAQKDDYYHKGKEPAGEWFGRGAEEFGLTGQLHKRDFERLCAGLHPENFDHLVKHAGTPRRRVGWDLTFSAPKSVSALWATASEEVRDTISDCQRQAVIAALKYVETHLGLTRVGKSGKEFDQCEKLFAGLFEHASSRALDPQLHTHAFLINLGINGEGNTRTLESIDILRAKMMLGAFYRCELAAELENRLGVELIPGEKGTFEIAGVSEELIENWSKRRAEVEAELEKKGLKGAKAAQVATLGTRGAKEYVDREELFEFWRDEAKEHNFEWRDCVFRDVKQESSVGLNQEFEKIEKELTKGRAYFNEKDVLRKLAEYAATAGVGLDEVLKAGKDYLDRNAVHLDTEERQKVYTTHDILTMERQMMETVIAGKERVYETRGSDFKITGELSEEQLRAVRHITGSQGQVKVVSGMAGTGKTTMLKCGREIWEQQGYEVRGVAAAAAAAENLQHEAGIKSSSIAKLLYDIDKAAKEEVTYKIVPGTKRFVWREEEEEHGRGGDAGEKGRRESRAERRERKLEEKLQELYERKGWLERAKEREQQSGFEKTVKDGLRTVKAVQNVLRPVYAEYKYATFQWSKKTRDKYLGEYYKPSNERYHEVLYATHRISKDHRDYLNYLLWKAELEKVRVKIEREATARQAQGEKGDAKAERPPVTSKPVLREEETGEQKVKVENHPLSATTVLIVDEAAMVGTKDMSRLIEECRKTGARLILVGDERQLQPVEHGQPFTLIANKVGQVTLTEIRRQREEWARQSVHDFADGKAEKALSTYLEHGLFHMREKRADVIKDMIDVWVHDPNKHSEKVILSNTNETVRELNRKAQEGRGSKNELGEKSVHLNGYEIHENDRVLFTKNEKRLDVKNGYLGTVRTIDERTGDIIVKLDSGELRKIPTADYTNVELGYAMTTHKAQGKTVNSAYILVGGSMQDREITYVQMSRHRDVARIYAAVEDVGMSIERLAERMNQSRQKESAMSQQEKAREKEQAAEMQAQEAAKEAEQRRLAEEKEREKQQKEAIEAKEPEREREEEATKKKGREKNRYEQFPGLQRALLYIMKKSAENAVEGPAIQAVLMAIETPTRETILEGLDKFSNVILLSAAFAAEEEEYRRKRDDEKHKKEIDKVIEAEDQYLKWKKGLEPETREKLEALERDLQRQVMPEEFIAYQKEQQPQHHQYRYEYRP